MDIHKTEQSLKTLWVRTEKYCSKDIGTIRKFQDEMYANGLSNNRVLLYLNAIYSISKSTKKKLTDLTKDDVKEIVAEIEHGKKAEWTKVKYKLTLKKFYQFVDKLEWYSKEYPERVKWIKSGARKSKLLRPIILTEDEVKRMFKVADRGREKAMCSFMYESGCRCPDELLHMKIGDVEFDEYGAKVKLTSGKVGTRTIRIIASVPYMKIWINEEHPDSRSDNWLWVSKSDRNRNKPINYQSLKLAVRKWRELANIDKKITAYTFRRTRYTHLATRMPTPLLYRFMGQVQGSKVIDRYVELNDEAVDGAILNFYNITKPENNGSIKPLFCSRCNKQNPPELEFCNICHAPLTEKALIEIEDKKKVEMRALFDELKKEFKEEMGGNSR